MLQKYAATLLSIVLVGCATRAPVTSEYHEFAKNGVAPEIDLSIYESVQKRPGPQDPNIIVAAAMSGGGHRAANFGAGVLQALEKLEVNGNSNVLKEIDYFSTVSGGGFATGSYLTTFFDHLSVENGQSLEEKIDSFSYSQYLNGKPPENWSQKKLEKFCRSSCKPYQRPVCVRRNLERGYHNAVFSGLWTPSIWFSGADRGDNLEKKIDQRLLGSCWRETAKNRQKSLVLGDFFKPLGTEAPILPYWVTNATVFENGAIFPFTPDILKRYCIFGYRHNLKPQELPGAPDGCNANHYQFPMAFGVKASASFPAAVPASTLESSFDTSANPYLHLIDGGVSDNIGVLTAINLLKQDSNGRTGTQGNIRKILLVVDAFKDNQEPFSKSSGSPSFIQVPLKITTQLPLSSWRSRYMSIVGGIAACSEPAIDPIFLSFDTVIYADPVSVEGCDYSPEKIQEAAKKVATSFNVKKEEQHILLCAGKMAVQVEKDRIVDLFTSAKIGVGMTTGKCRGNPL